MTRERRRDLALVTLFQMSLSMRPTASLRLSR